ERAPLGRWLRDRVDEQADKDGGGPLKIMYRVDGTSDLTEDVLEHWEGYRGSAPVRIGNGAAGQLQLDISGGAVGLRPAGVGQRELGPAGGGHLGDPRRPAGFHVRPADVLGGAGPRHPA